MTYVLISEQAVKDGGGNLAAQLRIRLQQARNVGQVLLALAGAALRVKRGPYLACQRILQAGDRQLHPQHDLALCTQGKVCVAGVCLNLHPQVRTGQVDVQPMREVFDLKTARQFRLQLGQVLHRSSRREWAMQAAKVPAVSLCASAEFVYTERVRNRLLIGKGVMEFVIDLLVEQPLLLLFIVMALGYALGEIKIKGTGLGVAAVLFVGLAFGALDERLTLPPLVVTLGLVLFVYSVGLASGPGFFASFSRNGLRDNLLVAGALIFAALIVVVEHFVLGFKPSISAGIFTGALTNTPALAQVTSYVATNAPADIAKIAAGEPVVGYSVSYPMGVIGPMLAIVIMSRLWKINFRADAERVRDMFPVEQEIYNRTVRISNPTFTGISLHELGPQKNWRVIFGRIKHGDVTELTTRDTVLHEGDLLSVIGTPEDVDAVVRELGAPAKEQLDLDRSAYDFRRVFVSKHSLVGKKLSDLDLPEKFGAIVTRVRRGDIELLAAADTVLELGDRVRFVAPRGQIKAISDFFGDSYRSLSEINLLSMGLGITIGLLIGMIPIALPGGIQFKLGDAGGPLIVALILSALRRTGPIVWSVPYSANLTLRQLGLTILLAGIGVRSGFTFLETLQASGGLQILLAGAAVSLATAFVVLFVGYKVLKIPFGLVIGMMAAVHTQPAVQAYAVNRAKNDLPNHGYALAFPMATIAKILLAQILVAFLPGGF